RSWAVTSACRSPVNRWRRSRSPTGSRSFPRPVPRRANSTERQREVAVGVGPPRGELESRVLQLLLDARSAELGADLRAHLLAVGERNVELECVDAHGLGAERAQTHLDPLPIG